MRWKMVEAKMNARKCCFQCVRYLSLKTVKTIKIKQPPVIVWASIVRWISIDRIHCVIHFYLIFLFAFIRRTHSNVRRIHGIDFFHNSIWTRWWSWKWILYSCSAIRCTLYNVCIYMRLTGQLHIVNQLLPIRHLCEIQCACHFWKMKNTSLHCKNRRYINV